MGTDVIVISNHTLDYSDFDFDRLGQELAARLNRIQLPGDEAFAEHYWYHHNRTNPTEAQLKQVRQPWFHQNDEWNRQDFYTDDWRRGQIRLDGPLEWRIEITAGKVVISLFPFRYWSWMGQYDDYGQRSQMEGQEFRNYYRHVLKEIVAALGGNEVTYLADNSHPLEIYWDEDNYHSIKQKLLSDLGPPRRSYQEMWKWYEEFGDNYGKSADTAYWVDNFQDLAK